MTMFRKVDSKIMHKAQQLAEKQGAIDTDTKVDQVEQFNNKIPSSVAHRFERFCAAHRLRKGETVAEALTTYMNMKGFEL